jgi:hypothetical protein
VRGTGAGCKQVLPGTFKGKEKREGKNEGLPGKLAILALTLQFSESLIEARHFFVQVTELVIHQILKNLHLPFELIGKFGNASFIVCDIQGYPGKFAFEPLGQPGNRFFKALS